jgi:sporadic carbohydrate cluster 2OG-Fe(II) oxygenase
MNLPTSFYDSEEQYLAENFLSNGFVKNSVFNPLLLDKIRELIVGLAAEHLGHVVIRNPADFLNNIHTLITPHELNELRLTIIKKMNQEKWLRPVIYQLASNALNMVVGNELAMQMRVNLSIQLPGDDSSLLPIHADVWSGDSPFEVVAWLPLVDCYRTKSMYLLPPGPSQELQKHFHEFADKSSEDIYRKIEREVQWMDVDYGEFLLFNQNLPHGNRINKEGKTRWSLNCRFKSVFSPYADKKLGEFFEPITLRAASRVGMSYQLPGEFND